jgi:hypothetical protein
MPDYRYGGLEIGHKRGENVMLDEYMERYKKLTDTLKKVGDYL